LVKEGEYLYNQLTDNDVELKPSRIIGKVQYYKLDPSKYHIGTDHKGTKWVYVNPSKFNRKILNI